MENIGFNPQAAIDPQRMGFFFGASTIVTQYCIAAREAQLSNQPVPRVTNDIIEKIDLTYTLLGATPLYGELPDLPYYITGKDFTTLSNVFVPFFASMHSNFCTPEEYLQQMQIDNDSSILIMPNGTLVIDGREPVYYNEFWNIITNSNFLANFKQLRSHSNSGYEEATILNKKLDELSEIYADWSDEGILDYLSDQLSSFFIICMANIYKF